MKVSRGDRIFNIANTTALTIFTILVLIPFWYVMVNSIMDFSYFADKNGLIFFPSFKHISFDYYSYLILENKVMLNSYLNTVVYTVVGTAVALILTVFTAYGLSIKTLPGRKFINLLFVFTMYFGGGMVPTYVTLKGYKLLDTRAGYILILCFTVFNVVLMKTFFEGIPKGFKESASIDGASEIRILFQIILPLSLPALTTIALFYAVGYWNDFINAMLYASQIKITTVQKVLLDIVQNSSVPSEMAVTNGRQVPSQLGIRMASIVIVAMPMMLLYPFVQKYFEKGITLGGEKG